MEDNEVSCSLSFRSRAALSQALLPSIFTRALFGCPNNQQQGFNEPGLMPVMILTPAPREFPPALIPVFPQPRAANEAVDGMLHICHGNINH